MGHSRLGVSDATGWREYVSLIPLVCVAGAVSMRRSKFSVVKTLQAIEEANVVLIVIDARETITDQDLNLIGFALNINRSIVIAVNK